MARSLNTIRGFFTSDSCGDFSGKSFHTIAMAKREGASEMNAAAGLRLKAARLALGIDRQEVMASQLGVSVTAYSNYETGYRLANPYMLVRLLHLTGIGPDWVYGGSTHGVPFGLAESLIAYAADIGAVAGGRVAEWQMAAERRGKIAAAVPKRRRSFATLHESPTCGPKAPHRPPAD